jgi:hypothetical protein
MAYRTGIELGNGYAASHFGVLLEEQSRIDEAESDVVRIPSVTFRAIEWSASTATGSTAAWSATAPPPGCLPARPTSW